SEIRDSHHDTIRLLNVADANNPTPLEDFSSPVAWQTAGPETVGHWSAVCYFFARELQKTTHAPVGLLHSSWSGSDIRPWLSAQALRAQGGRYPAALDLLSLYARDARAAQNGFALEWEQWWRGKTGERPGSEPWNTQPQSGARGAAEAGAGAWRTAPAGLGNWRGWGVPELQDFNGAVWYRSTIQLTASQAKLPATLALGAINQVDQTWINGRPVGNTFGYGAERTYPLPAGMLHAGENTLVVNVFTSWDGGGLLGDPGKRALHLSGGESIPLAGEWQYRIVPASIGHPPRAPWDPIAGVATLYNAMIAPLGAYGLRGMLWYQGESNTEEAESYQGLLRALMLDRRRQFSVQLPVLVVQLPNFGPPVAAPTESGWATLREAQRLAVAGDEHAGLAVTIDIGEPDNLHPTNKQDVGIRLARAARKVIYGEPISPSGPVPRSLTQSSSQIAIEFADVERSLVAYSHRDPIGFELCAEGPHTCQFAQARIDGTKVLLAIPSGVPPTRVRYCWGASPVCTLYDLAGLPAGPFELPIHQPVAAAAHANARPAIIGISHIAVYTTDSAKTEHYYVHDLGALKGEDPESPRGVRYYFSPTQFVEVLPLPSGPPSINRLDHVAFITTDAQALRHYLTSRKLTVPRQVERCADGSRWLDVLDPEGNKVEFVQPASRSADVPLNPLSNHIIHVGFIVHNRPLEDSFFRAILGFKPYWFGGMKDDKTNWVSQQVPDGTDWLEYMMVGTPDSHGIPPTMSQADLGVLNHFSLGVQDIRVAYTLLWKGDRLSGQTNTPKIGRDAKWQLNLVDPDGTRTEFMELQAIGEPCCSPFTAPDPQADRLSSEAADGNLQLSYHTAPSVVPSPPAPYMSSPTSPVR
ncbi:MAG: hypothetical protein JO042_00960, partial [Sinobacteraceae bacterium]|nr:hypothetical protein [Nevskiaceae bacterium]